MALVLEVILLLYNIGLFCVFSNALLDIEELRSVQYGLDIVPEPVLLEKEGSSNVFVHVSSKHGQQYQCSLPDNDVDKKWRQEKEKEATEIGISELLKSMENDLCLLYIRDWWTYEFCYGKTVKQFHAENGIPIGEILLLGKYESEKDWNNQSQEADKKIYALNRYHSQQYVNGTTCDITGKPRRVEVRFMCDEGSGDIISRIEEPETCIYVLTIKTFRICHHPYLKHPMRKQVKKVTCNPALSEEELTNYMSQKQSEIVEKKKKVLVTKQRKASKPKKRIRQGSSKARNSILNLIMALELDPKQQVKLLEKLLKDSDSLEGIESILGARRNAGKGGSDKTVEIEYAKSGNKKQRLIAEQLEKSVEKELLKAGISTGEKKIKVKIITAGAYRGTSDEDVHILTEEDTKKFNNMIVSMLGGGNLAEKEADRQNIMESTYKYNYHGRKKTKQPGRHQKSES